jgi:hypothetical protein
MSLPVLAAWERNKWEKEHCLTVPFPTPQSSGNPDSGCGLRVASQCLAMCVEAGERGLTEEALQQEGWGQGLLASWIK